jgi:hypothetical protein
MARPRDDWEAAFKNAKAIKQPDERAPCITTYHFWKLPETARSQIWSTFKALNVMTDDLSDLEIAVLCDLLDGPGANLKAHKRAVLDQLVAKGWVEPAEGEPAKFQLSDKAHHLLAERGVGISGG